MAIPLAEKARYDRDPPSAEAFQFWDLAISLGYPYSKERAHFYNQDYRSESNMQHAKDYAIANQIAPQQPEPEPLPPFAGTIASVLTSVPEAVTITVSLISENSASINWSPNSAGGSSIIGYHYVLVNQNTGQTLKETDLMSGQRNSLEQNLTPSTTYRAYIIAKNQYGNSPESKIEFKTLGIITPTPVIIPDGFHEMPDGSIMADSDMYNFIIESDGLVRMFRIGAVEYTEIKIQPDSVQSIIDRNIGRLLTAEERAIPYPRPEPTPEPTFCVNTYNIRDSGSVYSTHYEAITSQKVQELQENQFVVSCDATTLPSEKEVQDFYGFTPLPPAVDTSINSTMVSQSVGAFILKDGRLKGEILYIANQSFNPFYYSKNLISLVQIKSKSGIPIAVKPNNLNFTNTERDERIQIDEAVGNFKELIVDFFVWDTPLSMKIFSDPKQIQVVEELPPPNGDDDDKFKPCQAGYHKDFSGKCVPDDPLPELPRDKLIDTLKGFLFGTVALSLLARKY